MAEEKDLHGGTHSGGPEEAKRRAENRKDVGGVDPVFTSGMVTDSDQDEPIVGNVRKNKAWTGEKASMEHQGD